MIKFQHVPAQLLAQSQRRLQPGREAAVPLFLHAFEPTMLGDPPMASAGTAEADFGDVAEGFLSCDDEDDDFY